MTKKKHKKKQKKAHLPLAAPQPELSLSDQYMEKADQLFASIGDGLADTSSPETREAARQTLNAGIDTVLQSMALFAIEQADFQLKRGQLCEQEHRQLLDQALDNFNNPAGDTSLPLNQPVFIEGIDGKLIYLGD